MSPDPERRGVNVREPTPADHERIAAVVESSMTASYQLSPRGIQQILGARFDDDALASKTDREATVVRVAETGEDVEETTIVGYLEGTVEGSTGELDWLFVDPEHRGTDIGETLFETGRDALESAGADDVRATVLEANVEGQEFFERFGLEPAGDRNVEFGDLSLVENVYVDPSANVEAGMQAQEAEATDAAAMPETETEDDATITESEGGKALYVARDERESGEEAPFFVTYADEALTEQYGYYCSNCGSVDVTMDSTDRLACGECGNAHASRASESYDDSYL